MIIQKRQLQIIYRDTTKQIKPCYDIMINWIVD